jgi:hypothetical protein
MLLQVGNHGVLLERRLLTCALRHWVTWCEETEFTYTFENFFHPFVGELIEQRHRACPALS